MRVNVEPRRIEAAGQIASVTVDITNTSEIISGYTVRVLGADPSWVHVDDPAPTLFPGSGIRVAITLALPPDLPAGIRRMAVQVRESTPPHHTTVTEVELSVAEAPATTVALDPVTVTGSRRASFGVNIQNNGNTALEGTLAGADPEQKIRFKFTPETVRLAPGESLSAQLEVRSRRPFMGSPLVRPLGVRIDPFEGLSKTPAGEEQVFPEPQAMGSFVQKALFSRAAISLAGLLAAVTIFAVVITVALSGVVNQSAADRDLAIQVAQARQDGAGTGRATASGTVRLITTGEALPGVTVEAFAEADPNTALATTATNDEGGYAITGLADGSYLLRFRGAGYSDIWYPAAMDSSDAQPVEISGGGSQAGVDVVLGGLPATLAGTVTGDDVSASSVALQIPLDQLGDSADLGVVPGAADPPPDAAVGMGAVLRTVPVGSDGSFEITDVPSPAIYELVVTKPGYATEVQRVDLAGGEERAGITLRLREGDGLITGRVLGVSGPVGGAGIVASAGEVTARTVSVTEGDVGAFTLRGLPTPGTFTLVVSATGHAPQTLTVDLAAGQQLTGVSVTLGSDSGELFGRVLSMPGNSPAGGVTVTVSDGSATVQTVTQNTGTKGAWRLTGLDVPNTYTVTFSRDDLAAQTVQVGLDGYGRITSGGNNDSGIAVTMHPAGADLTGRVTLRNAVDGTVAPAGNVTVAAVSGPDTYTVTTASQPNGQVGAFVIPRLPPGTYTVTASRPGSTPASTTVTLNAGADRALDLQLAAPASIAVTVRGTDGFVTGAVVNLYLATQYGTAAAPVATERTGPDGQVFFQDLAAPERYIVDVRLQTSGAPVAASDPLTLSASQAARVTLTVGDPPASSGSPE